MWLFFYWLLVEQWNVAICVYYDTIRTVHVPDTAIVLGSASSFLFELFHMFADLKLHLGKHKLVIAEFHCFFLSYNV